MGSRLSQWLHGSERRTAPERVPSPRCFELVGRARVTLEIADRTLHPSEPFAHGTAEGSACELYGQAVYWALSARMELEQPEGAPQAAAGSLTALLERADPRVLASAADGAASVERVRALLSKSFIELAQLGPKDGARGAEQLRSFAQALLAPLESDERRLERYWARRVSWLVSAAVAIAVVALVTRWVAELRERSRDLAPHATWSVSSFWQGCSSPAQQCPQSPNFFFHTNEEMDPSITFDLGREQQVSALSIENRADCCGERAVPLVVEVSSDGKSFKEVARRKARFTIWHPHLHSVRARFIKLHVPKRTNFHLARVRIIP